MCQFCTLIFLLKLINFLKKDFPRRGPVFLPGGPGLPAPVLATPLHSLRKSYIPDLNFPTSLRSSETLTFTIPVISSSVFETK